MTEALSPGIKVISKSNSPFSFSITFSVSKLPPNEKFQLWKFYPDNEAIGATPFISDTNGNALTPQGKNEIPCGISSSDILPNGDYKFGININNFQFNNKPYFD